jgi:ferredoxin
MMLAIDETRCCGHGRCWATAPDLFDCDERGYGVVRDPHVPPDRTDAARLARDSCPERAITT